LTPDDLRTFVRVDPDVIRVQSELALQHQARGIEAEREVVLGMSPSAAELEAAAAAMDGIPELRRVFEEHGWTGLEYLRTFYATVVAMLEIELSVPRPGANARLLRDLPSELATALEEWKQRRMPGLEMFRQPPPGDAQ
jgi:hypothetical protein